MGDTIVNGRGPTRTEGKMEKSERLADSNWMEKQPEKVTIESLEHAIARLNHRLANLEARVRVTNGPFFGPEAFNRIRSEVLTIENERTDLEKKLKAMKEGK